MIDAHQFEAFVRTYQDMVFATAVRLLGNAAEAEDVAQTCSCEPSSASKASARARPSAGG